jgi:uncharacterized membrane protein
LDSTAAAIVERLGEMIDGIVRTLERAIGSDVDDHGVSLKRTLATLFVVAAILTLIVAATVGVIIYFSDGLSEFGTWGDFFGGFLNPILTFITFCSVLITIILQQNELSLARREFTRSADALEKQIQAIDKQNFESTFFGMLSLHNELVEAIVTRRTSFAGPGQVTEKVWNGREAFLRFTLKLSDTEDSIAKNTEFKDMRGLMEAAYRHFWGDSRQALGHYFRYLYNVIRFVEDSNFAGPKYMRLLRAQLSDYELVLIMYNCLSEQGAAFKVLVEKHKILNNLEPSLLKRPEDMYYMAKSAFGEGYPKLPELV